jgi:hypothetical protein
MTSDCYARTLEVRPALSPCPLDSAAALVHPDCAVLVFSDSIKRAPDVAKTAARLIRACDELQHLQLLRLCCLRSQNALVMHRKPFAAVLLDPEHLGAPQPLRVVFRFLLAELARDGWYVPDYLLLVDTALFDSQDDTARERAIYHELAHLEHRENEHGPMFDDEGRPALALRAHDVELFDGEIYRYPEAAALMQKHAAQVHEMAKSRTRSTLKLA